MNLGANATTHNATGLTAGTTYWFRVRATNAGGSSANSNVASATTQSGNGTGTGTGLAATYFNNTNFTGTFVSRTDATVNFNWGNGSPASGISGNTFSSRWLGQVQAIESGTYRFRTHSDEGIRLWVNGQQIINNWTAHTLAVDTSVAITLAAGMKYEIKLHHFDNTGAAVARLMWQRPGQTTYAAIPQSQLYVPGDGLSAVFFDNMDLTGTSVSRIDSTVNFNWGTGRARDRDRAGHVQRPLDRAGPGHRIGDIHLPDLQRRRRPALGQRPADHRQLDRSRPDTQYRIDHAAGRAEVRHQAGVLRKWKWSRDAVGLDATRCKQFRNCSARETFQHHDLTSRTRQPSSKEKARSSTRRESWRKQPEVLPHARRRDSISVVSSRQLSIPNRGARDGKRQQLAGQGEEEAQEGREGGAREGGPAAEEEVTTVAGVE